MASFPPPRPPTSTGRGKQKRIWYEEEEVVGMEGGSHLGRGEGLNPFRPENQESDLNQIMEHKGKGCMQSGSATQGTSPSNALIDVCTVWTNVSDLKGSESIEENVNENYRTNIGASGSGQQMPPRSHGPQIRRTRDSSNVAEVDSNKRLKIACEFHAQGWCIRGNSCRFLHLNEGLDTFDRKAVVGSSGGSIAPEQSGDSHNSGALERTPLQVGENVQQHSNMHNLRIDVQNSEQDCQPSIPCLPSRTTENASNEGKKDDGINYDIDDPLQLGTKALKFFQAALIQYIKELLEPAWLEGLVPKDTYKLIVKKSVDKVISSFQPHQIPSSPESVKSYIASCQDKLEKLVQGYLVKYMQP